MFLNLISDVETLTEGSADLSQLLFQLWKNFLFSFSFTLSPFLNINNSFFLHFGLAFPVLGMRAVVLLGLKFWMCCPLCWASTDSSMRWVFVWGSQLRSQVGGKAFGEARFLWGFQVLPAHGECTALSSKSHPHRPVSLGCSWGDLPLFALSWIQEGAACSGSCWVLRTDLVVSWLPCFKAINSVSVLFWKNWQSMWEMQSRFKNLVKGWGLDILSSDWSWCLQFICCERGVKEELQDVPKVSEGRKGQRCSLDSFKIWENLKLFGVSSLPLKKPRPRNPLSVWAWAVNSVGQTKTKALKSLIKVTNIWRDGRQKYLLDEGGDEVMKQWRNKSSARIAEFFCLQFFF